MDDFMQFKPPVALADDLFCCNSATTIGSINQSIHWSLCRKTTKQETSQTLRAAFLFLCLMKSIPFKNSKAPYSFRLLD